MFSDKIVAKLKASSFIRVMFEEGERLRKIYGPDKVYDFSLGNPDAEPPDAVKEALKRHLTSDPDIHKYMNNAGYDDVREKIAAQIQNESGVSISSSNIVMTCGAAGGLNVALKALLNPGEEVIVFAPYFVEYGFYIDNHGGTTVIVPPDTETFEPNLAELEKLITKKTKAIIINTPNNPTGVVYSEEVLTRMAALIEEKEKQLGTNIYILSDEPYTKLIYDVTLPSVLKIFKNSIIVTSFSKSLSLPGERIGYIAANSAIENIDILMNALIFCNRILGFVNAPSLMQKVISDSLDAVVDVEGYKKRRDLIYNHLTSIGFSCKKPEGAFYLFPKSPIPDDVEFKNRALAHNILIVPGSGFGCPGFFRLAYCVRTKALENSLPAFEALIKEFI